MDKSPLKVALLLSGGVDSSLSLHLLKAAGHDVTAFYLQIWFQEDFRNYWDSCPWEEDLEYCKAVCEKLGVKLEVVPLSTEYWNMVVQDSIREVKAGRTPNPDILCNSRVKFGAFYRYLTSQYGAKFDRIASGHYAQIIRTADGTATLGLTRDAVKDQTYFLAHLSGSQLQRTMFPLGGLTKSEVRELADLAHLPNKSRKDSQGICFLGKVKFDEFIKEHLGEWHGPLVEEETQLVVGYHQGYWFYTVGQRKGINLSGGPWYVTRKDTRNNAIYISRHYNDSDFRSSTRSRSSFVCTDLNWLGPKPPPHATLHCKVRHGPKLYECSFRYTKNENSARVELDGVDQGLAAGQYAVFYENNTCLGSGKIIEQ